MKPRNSFYILSLIWVLLLGGAACSFTYSIDFGNSSRRGQTNLSNNAIVEVPAATQWSSTGIIVRPGDTLIIQYLAGSWSPWPGGNVDALGSGGDPRCPCNVIMGVSHAALIGKIGDNPPFLVGESFHQKVAEGGVVYLGINDNRLSDNSGSLTVKIEKIH